MATYKQRRQRELYLLLGSVIAIRGYVNSVTKRANDTGLSVEQFVSNGNSFVDESIQLAKLIREAMKNL